MCVFKCPRCGQTTRGDEKLRIKRKEPLKIECPEYAGKWRFIYNNMYCSNCGYDMRKNNTDCTSK